MQFIAEPTIDQIAEKLGNDEAARAAAVEALRAEQPVLLAYLFSEGFDALLHPEREYVLFLTLVIVEAVKAQLQKTPPPLTEEQLGEAEEANWEQLQNVSTKKFRERLDVFFTDTPQEDLLAFIEDALIDEEDGLLSKEGREPIFVALKSVVDALHQAG